MYRIDFLLLHKYHMKILLKNVDSYFLQPFPGFSKKHHDFTALWEISRFLRRSKGGPFPMKVKVHPGVFFFVACGACVACVFVKIFTKKHIDWSGGMFFFFETVGLWNGILDFKHGVSQLLS